MEFEIFLMVMAMFNIAMVLWNWKYGNFGDKFRVEHLGDRLYIKRVFLGKASHRALHAIDIERISHAQQAGYTVSIFYKSGHAFDVHLMKCDVEDFISQLKKYVPNISVDRI